MAVVFNCTTVSDDEAERMRVFVAGATGVVGRRLVRQLAVRGHEVVALARGPEKEGLVRRLGGTPVRGDLFDADSLPRWRGAMSRFARRPRSPRNPASGSGTSR